MGQLIFSRGPFPSVLQQITNFRFVHDVCTTTHAKRSPNVSSSESVVQGSLFVCLIQIMFLRILMLFKHLICTLGRILIKILRYYFIVRLCSNFLNFVLVGLIVGKAGAVDLRM